MTQTTINDLIASGTVIGALAMVGGTIRYLQRRWLHYLEDRDEGCETCNRHREIYHHR